MAIRSGFFNSVNGDRKYLASRFAEYFASFIGNGVFPQPSNGLQVIANNDMTVTIKAGKAWIDGYIMINDDDYILTIDPADGVLNRIDRIVARYDVVDREIRLEVKKGTFASNPIPKELQRDADAYELGIADIYVGKGAISITQANITDLRKNKEICGLVDSLIAGDINTLVADLESHKADNAKHFSPIILTGLKSINPYIMPGWSVVGSSNAKILNNQILYVPIFLNREMSFNSVKLKVTQAGVNSSVELRLYGMDMETTLPTSEVLNIGIVDTTTMGNKEIIGSFTLAAGYYFLALRSEGDSWIGSISYTAGINFTCPVTARAPDSGAAALVYQSEGYMSNPALPPGGFRDSLVPIIHFKL